MAYVEPSTVAQGESTLLVWEAANATQVLISQGIGPVVPEGQIKIFPDQTTTYRVRAEGPGGSTEQLVTVEVTLTGAPSVDPGGEIPLQERFNTYIKPVFFGFDSAELSQEAKVTLDGNIRWLKQEGNGELRFSIEGHCDQRGTEEYNLALGDKRARVVRDYLVRGGIAGANIVTVTMGEESPFAAGDSEETHALNRRAHFVLIPTPGSSQNR
jgi:peptidoglycan-associated lipoprotein